jgi:PTH2 family peptidyl-tRNA hydrolase
MLPTATRDITLVSTGVALGFGAAWLLNWRQRTTYAESECDGDESDSEEENPRLAPPAHVPVRDDYHADGDEPYKMLLIFNMELYRTSTKTGERKAVKMSPGKAGAQSGHATLGAYRRGRRLCPRAVSDWLRIGQAKITVKCPTVGELLELQTKCSAAGLNTYLIRDAGHTEIEPGSRTVLAVGPAPASAFKDLTGHLKPY